MFTTKQWMRLVEAGKAPPAYKMMRGQCAYCRQWLGPSHEKNCRSCGAPRTTPPTVFHL